MYRKGSLPPQALLLLSSGKTGVQMLVDKVLWHTYRTNWTFHWKKADKYAITYFIDASTTGNLSVAAPDGKKNTLDTTENIIFPFLSIQPSEQIIFAM